MEDNNFQSARVPAPYSSYYLPKDPESKKIDPKNSFSIRSRPYCPICLPDKTPHRVTLGNKELNPELFDHLIAYPAPDNQESSQDGEPCGPYVLPLDQIAYDMLQKNPDFFAAGNIFQQNYKKFIVGIGVIGVTAGICVRPYLETALKEFITKFVPSHVMK